jgi:ribosomal protein L11 methyltransferase
LFERKKAVSTIVNPCLCIVAPVKRAEELSWMLVDLGAVGVEQRDSTTMDKPDEGCTELVAGFSDVEARENAIRELEDSVATEVEICRLDIEDDGWSTKWREFFRPVILDMLQVVTPWMEIPRKDLIPIIIDPGQAFGTGGHTTTKLILEMLEHRTVTNQLPASVLDVGTGSGILAIAAAKLGAKEVTAVDIDPESVLATRENARINGEEDSISVYEGNSSAVSGQWPLVLANLELGLFLTCATAVAEKVAPGGEALLSGLLSDQVEPCLALWPGFRMTEKREQNGWISLALEPIP